MAITRIVPTSVGDGRVTIDEATEPRATLVLGHGAGGGITAPDLVALANALPARGITVVRVEQPYRVAGERIGPKPEVLDATWREILGNVAPTGPIVVGGRSAGARVACRMAKDSGTVAVVALAFPLHPPGKPDRTRAGELLGSGVPTLVIQGDRDPFGRPGEFPLGEFVLHVLPGADHQLAVVESAATNGTGHLRILVQVVGEWLDGVLN